MKYDFSTVKLYDKDKLVMEFDGKHEILTNIFNEIVLDYDNKNDWLNAIEDSLTDNLEKHDFGVPGFGVEVEKENTIVYSEFTDEEIKISTEEFKKISELWFEKLEELNNTKKL